jgi:hypothetical protein
MLIRTLSLAALLMTGCGIDDGSPTDEGGGKADGNAAVTLPSTYALELVSDMRLEDTRETGADRFSEYHLRARAHVTTRQNGDDVTLTVKLCDVVLPEVGGYQPELDRAFVATIPAFTVDATIAANMDGARRLSSEDAALVLGAQLANPLTDALPAANSTRLRDQDRDGKPAVSVRIPGYGSIYAALRVKLSIDAPLSNAAQINGAAEIDLAQRVYGDDIWFYDAAASAAEAAPHTRVVEATNTFRMRGNAQNCARVTQLFP